MDDDFDPMPTALNQYTGDAILDRGNLLADLAVTLNDVKDSKARALLLKYMATVEGSVRPRSQAELHTINGGKLQ